MNNDKQQRIEQIMKGLDGMKRAEADPFLYTRIEQRLKNRFEPTVNWFPKLALALGCFMILNIASFALLKDPDTTSNKNTNGVEAFANEYGISNNDI